MQSGEHIGTVIKQQQKKKKKKKKKCVKIPRKHHIYKAEPKSNT